MFDLKLDGLAGDPPDIPQDAVRAFYENNEAFRRLWHAHQAAGQRLAVLEAMPSPYIQVETEMLRRRQSALAEQIADLVRRRQANWQASPGEVKTGPTPGSAAAGRSHPDNLRVAAMAWKPEG